MLCQMMVDSRSNTAVGHVYLLVELGKEHTKAGGGEPKNREGS